MITILARRHLFYDSNGNDVAIVHLAVTTASDLPAANAIPNLIIHEGSKAWAITSGAQYGFTTSGGWNEQEVGLDIVKLKGTVDSVSDLPSNAEPGWIYFVGLSTDPELEEYLYTDSGTWERIGSTTIVVDSALSSESENPVQNKVVTGAITEIQTTIGNINSVLEEVL